MKGPGGSSFRKPWVGGEYAPEDPLSDRVSSVGSVRDPELRGCQTADRVIHEAARPGGMTLCPFTFRTDPS